MNVNKNHLIGAIITIATVIIIAALIGTHYQSASSDDYTAPDDFEFEDSLDASELVDQQEFNFTATLQLDNTQSDRQITTIYQIHQTSSGVLQQENEQASSEGMDKSSYLPNNESTVFVTYNNDNSNYYHRQVQQAEVPVYKNTPSFTAIFDTFNITLDETNTTDNGTSVAHYEIQGLSRAPTDAADRDTFSAHILPDQFGNIEETSGQMLITENGFIKDLSYTITLSDGQEFDYHYTVTNSGDSISPTNASWIDIAREEGLNLTNYRVTENAVALDVANGNLTDFDIEVSFHDPYFQGTYGPASQDTIAEGDTLYLTVKDDDLVATTTQPTAGELPGDEIHLMLQIDRGTRIAYDFPPK